MLSWIWNKYKLFLFLRRFGWRRGFLKLKISLKNIYTFFFFFQTSIAILFDIKKQYAFIIYVEGNLRIFFICGNIRRFYHRYPLQNTMNFCEEAVAKSKTSTGAQFIKNIHRCLRRSSRYRNKNFIDFITILVFL